MHFYRGSGAGAARYFDEGHKGAEAYYSEQSRVAVEIDTWRAGERVGTTTLAEPGDLIAWVEGSDPVTGEVKGVIRAGGKEREPLRFVEVVVNNPKSLSIVASQNPAVSVAYDAVLSRQADEIAKYLSAVAVTRIGPRGAQLEVGDLSIETARVLHLTSREGDPHRHVHLMLNTRVMSPDGTWHGLHSAAIRQHIRAINERGSRILLSDGELRAVLAREGYSLGRDGEIVEARDAVALLSKRSAEIAANREAAEAVWRAGHPDREPSQRVKNGWDQKAWADGRPAKSGERETPEQLSKRVGLELSGAGFDFSPGARRRAEPDKSVPVALSVGEVDRDQVADEVVAVLSAQKSAWSSADLNAEVEAAVARSGLVGDPQAVTELVEDVAARATESCLSVLNPEVHAPSAMSRHLTSQAVVNADMALNLGLAGLVAGGESRDHVGWDHVGWEMAVAKGLDRAQAEAVAAMCGPGRLEVVIGPAGTGKTTMLGVAKERLAQQGRELVVVAPTRKGAQVAGAEVGAHGAALSKLLHDNGWRWDFFGRWSRLGVGEEDPGSGRTYHGAGEGSVLSASSVVVVDEAGLMTVDQANALIDLAAASGAAIRLVGDPRQLGAVGRGGVMETAARWSGKAVTLDEVHRFLRLETDEAGLLVTGVDLDYAELSLLLREGTNPDQAAGRLVGRGAVVVHKSEADAVAAIAAEVSAKGGREGGLAVTVATNDDARAVNEAVRDLRIQAGQVDDSRTAIGMEGVLIGAGDRVVTRRNDTARGVANREAWTVEAVTGDGTVLAVNGQRRVRLDADYVAVATELGYATTDYGNQGVTTDRSLTWVTDATTAGGLYVGATRGRYENTLHVVAADHDDAQQLLVTAIGRDRADRGLEVARARAEADARAVRTHQVTGAGRPAERRELDLANWRSERELDLADRAIAARLVQQTRFLGEVPVMAEGVAEQENRAEQAAAGEARGRAAWHRGEAARIHGDRGDLLQRATADYFAARDDARVIEAGPGLLKQKAAKVEEAKARREETARVWNDYDYQLPGSTWGDEAVRNAAYLATERTLGHALFHHSTEAEREERVAAYYEKMITTRAGDRERAIAANKNMARQRDALIAVAEQARAEVAHNRQVRAELVKTMTPEEVAGADKARDTLLKAREHHVGRREARQVGRDLGPSIEHGGPGIEY